MTPREPLRQVEPERKRVDVGLFEPLHKLKRDK
jgi:hypothetical protein